MTVIAAAYKPPRGIFPARGAIGCDSMVSGSSKGLLASKLITLSDDPYYPAYGGVAGDAISIERLRDAPKADGVRDEATWVDYQRGISLILREAGDDSVLLTLSKWGIWEIYPDGVFKQATPIAGVGSGGPTAIGAMTASVQRPLWSPRRAVLCGLEGACTHAPGCGHPIKVVSF